MGKSLKEIAQALEAKGGVDITVTWGDLEDIHNLLNHMKQNRGEATFSSTMDLGSASTRKDGMTSCTCDVYDAPDTQSSSVSGCDCVSNCTCNSKDNKSCSPRIYYGSPTTCDCNTNWNVCTCNHNNSYCSCNGRCSCDTQCTCNTRCSCNADRSFA